MRFNEYPNIKVLIREKYHMLMYSHIMELSPNVPFILLINKNYP